MEKISGIIPANARTRSVDVSGSQPVRPGAPAYGRRTGRVTEANQNDSLSSDDKVTIKGAPLETQTPATYKPNPDAVRAKVVEDMANKFFNSNPKTIARDSDIATSEQFTESLAEG